MRWTEVHRAVPDLARDARASMDLGNHKTLATLRGDGSPRISAVEARFIDDDLVIASMWRTPKALDLLRDPRMALHSWSAEPDVWMGDAKITGRAEELMDAGAHDRVREVAGTAPPGRFHLFRIHVDGVVVLRLGDPPDHIVARRWAPGTAVETTTLA